MNEKRADLEIFADPGFLIAQALASGVLVLIGLVIWYVQT
jgi:hypothetical protein